MQKKFLYEKNFYWVLVRLLYAWRKKFLFFFFFCPNDGKHITRTLILATQKGVLVIILATQKGVLVKIRKYIK